MVLLSKNDKEAFSELYVRYWKKLFAIANNRLNNRQAAEDIVHDVFASLWANRAKVEIEQIENYLAVAVRFSVLTTYKKIARENKYKNSLSTAIVVDMPIEATLHYKKILELVKVEIERLPEKCRLIFKYSREAGLPVKEIARELNISPKTVENQLGKAVRQLKLATRSFLQSFLIFQ